MTPEAAPRKIVYLEMVAPLLDDPASRTKWLFWLDRDLPWAMTEGWTIEYWGLRTTRDRLRSWGQVWVRGPKLPFRRIPRVFIASLAWSYHFFMTLLGRPGRILVARSPYLAFGAALARVFRRRPPPLMVRIVERIPSTARVYGTEFIARRLDAIERFVLRRSDLVVPIAGFTREVAISAGVPEERIIPLANPPRSLQMNALPNTSDLLNPRLICAARLTPQKGVDVLIRGFAEVVEEFPTARLDIAGEGKERPSLERLSEELGIAERVRFHGWVFPRAMPELFASCLIAVLPSRVEEGHPKVLREAALAGCALIGSDHGGIRDIVRPDRTGILVPPQDSIALAEAIRRCLRDVEEARRMGEAARAEAVAHFSGRSAALERIRERVYTLVDERSRRRGSARGRRLPDES
jgi:glycosyltransferase involved in cell wall biosynthesis